MLNIFYDWNQSNFLLNKMRVYLNQMLENFIYITHQFKYTLHYIYKGIRSKLSLIYVNICHNNFQFIYHNRRIVNQL